MRISKHTTTAQKAAVLLMGLITTFGLNMDLTNIRQDSSWFLFYIRSMRSLSLNNILFFIGICCFFWKALQFIRKVKFRPADRFWIGLPAFLFANFMVWGYSFEQRADYSLVLAGKMQVLKAVTKTGAYFLIFYFCIACFYLFLERAKIQSFVTRPVNAYVKLLYQHPFITSFCTILICYIPYIILSYPATLMGDTHPMINEGFNFPNSASAPLQLLNENVFQTGKHLVYSVFLHICLVIGKTVFNSYNAGIFIVAITQLLASISAVALMISVLAKKHVRAGVLIAVMAYYVFAPRQQAYMFLITKDVFFGCTLLFYIVLAYELWKKPTKNAAKLIPLQLCSILIGILRNDGKYVLVLSAVSMIIFLGRQCRRQIIAISLTGLLAVICLSKVIMPAFYITPISTRAMLSIPFQQTARFIRDAGDDVREEEKQAIAAILPYEKLAELYTPEKADPVTHAYNTAASKEDLKNYLKVWFQMFRRHPGIYVQATMNNYYYYFYPGEKTAKYYSYQDSAKLMAVNCNGDRYLKTIGMDLHYPDRFQDARISFQNIRENIFKLPVLNMFLIPAYFVWLLMLLTCNFIRKRKGAMFALTMPLLSSLLICLAATCNGTYFRYLYGITFCLPAILLMGIIEIQDQDGKDMHCESEV